MHILFIVADGLNEFNSSNFRVAIPADALIRAGHNVSIINVRQWMHQTDYCKSRCVDADIIHLQRVLIRDTHDHIKYWRSKGKAVVADWDDYYSGILDDNAAAPFWYHGEVGITLSSGLQYDKKLEEHPIDQFVSGLQVCTAGITPSKILSKDYEVYTPTFVVENYLDTKLYRAAPKHNNSPYTVLGWGGSLSHVQSWRDSGIEDALGQILSERDDVRLLIIGDTRIRDQLPIRRDRIWFTPYIGWWDWQKTLMRYDIGLAPLAGEYDDRRSSLKVAEYLMAGLPFVASKSPVYERMWDADSGHFVKHDDYSYDDRVDDWYRSTIDIIDNIGHYNKLASDNIETWGMRYDIDRNVPNIIEVYQRIIDLEH